jgi:hypothetical protein
MATSSSTRRMIGGIEETSASFEARSAPRSYPTTPILPRAELQEQKRDLFMQDAGIAVLLAAVQDTARLGTAHGVRSFAYLTRLHGWPPYRGWPSTDHR